jgi:hypothetical protein
MYKRIFFIILMLIPAAQTGAQSRFSFRGVLDYNFFSMTDLKEVQDEVLVQLKFYNPGVTKKESFLPNLGFQLQGLKEFPSFGIPGINMGLLFGYTSTRGRLEFVDNAWEIRFDQVINIYSFGLVFETEHRVSKTFLFTLGFKVPLIYSELDNNQLMRYKNSHAVSAEQNDSFYSLTFGFEPDVNFFFNFSGILIGGNLGYMITLPEKYLLESDDNVYLVKGNNEAVRTGTSGLRMGVTLGYNFSWN